MKTFLGTPKGIIITAVVSVFCVTGLVAIGVIIYKALSTPDPAKNNNQNHIDKSENNKGGNGKNNDGNGTNNSNSGLEETPLSAEDKAKLAVISKEPEALPTLGNISEKLSEAYNRDEKSEEDIKLLYSALEGIDKLKILHEREDIGGFVSVRYCSAEHVLDKILPTPLKEMLALRDSCMFNFLANIKESRNYLQELQEAQEKLFNSASSLSKMIKKHLKAEYSSVCDTFHSTFEGLVKKHASDNEKRTQNKRKLYQILQEEVCPGKYKQSWEEFTA